MADIARNPRTAVAVNQNPTGHASITDLVAQVQASCDRELWRLLTYEGQWMYISGDLADQPRDALQRVVEALEPLERPVGPEGVLVTLAPLVVVFGTTEAAKSPAFWAVYIDVLADLPAYALEAGVRAYAREPDANWFPRPGPLRALAVESIPAVMKGLRRARMAIRRIDERVIARERRRAESDAEMDRLRGLLAPPPPSADHDCKIV
jgi:hypothetical protein